MFKTVRTFSSFSRPLLHSTPSLLRHNGPVTVRQVRFLRPVHPTLRRKVERMSLILGGIFFWFYILGGSVEIVDQAEQERQAKAKAIQTAAKPGAIDSRKFEGGQTCEEPEKHEHHEQEGQHTLNKDGNGAIAEQIPEESIFIPLGWPRECPKTFYKGTDPEWQSFLDFNNDRKRSMRIRNELAGFIGHLVANQKATQEFLGSEIKTRKYWLDIDFPNGPPPEYERSGIEVTEDYVAWTTRKVPYMQVSRLRTALFPISMATSFWAGYNTYWSLQLAKVRQYLNVDSAMEEPDSAKPTGYVDFQRLANDKRQSQPEPGNGKGDESKISGIPSIASLSDSKANAKGTAFPPLPSIPQPSGDLSSSLSSFKSTLVRTWKPAGMPPPRGTFLVSGLVEVIGSKGLIVMDVHAAYHPEQQTWRGMAMKVRRISSHKQNPKGGD